VPAGARIAIGALIVLHGLPYMTGLPYFWGLDQWKYLRGPWVWPVLALGTLLLIPPVSRILSRLLGKIDRFAVEERPRPAAVAIYIVVLPIAAFIMWTFRNSTHFLGDGYLWANNLMTGGGGSEPVSTWLYRMIYRGLNTVRVFGEVNPVRASAVTSVAAGLVFVAFIRKTALLLSERRGDYLLIALSLASCGAVMLFCGYVETYPPLAAGVMAYIYFSLRYLRRGGTALPALAAFIVTAVLHLSALALLPSLLLLLLYGAGKDIRGRSLYRFLLASLAAGLMILWFLRVTDAFGGFFREHFLPLLSSPSRQDAAYPLISLRALFDDINEVLLVAPLAVLIPVILLGRRTPGRDSGYGGEKDAAAGSSRERLFLAICVLSYLAVFAAFNKTIGASRDWDLFSPMAFPLALWIVLTLRRAVPEGRSELAVVFIAVILTHTAPWIILNTDLERSEARFIGLCDTGFWSNRAKGYGYSTLGQYERHFGRTLPAIFYYGRAAWSDPGNVRYDYTIGEMYSGLGKHGAALDAYFKVLERDGTHFQALNNAGVSYLEMGRPREAEPYLLRALEVEPASVDVMQNLGNLYLSTGRPREAVDIYLRAAALEPANAAIHIGLARAFIAYGDTASARRHVEAARSIDPGLPADLLERLQSGKSYTPSR